VIFLFFVLFVCFVAKTLRVRRGADFGCGLAALIYLAGGFPPTTVVMWAGSRCARAARAIASRVTAAMRAG